MLPDFAHRDIHTISFDDIPAPTDALTSGTKLLIGDASSFSVYRYVVHTDQQFTPSIETIPPHSSIPDDIKPHQYELWLSYNMREQCFRCSVNAIIPTHFGHYTLLLSNGTFTLCPAT